MPLFKTAALDVCTANIFVILLILLHSVYYFTQMITSTDNGDLRIIEGSLKGLDGLLFSFSSLVLNDPTILSDIHKYARMALNPQTTLKRYGVPLGNRFLHKSSCSC